MTLFSRIAAVAALTASLTIPATAHEFEAGDLMIDHPWSRPTIPNRPAAAYLTIHNSGAEADRLVRALSSAFTDVELHLSAKTDGVMTMQKVEAIEIPAGGMAELAPGGYHVMLFGGTQKMIEGDSFTLMLDFEKAGSVEVIVNIEKRGPETDHSTHKH